MTDHHHGLRRESDPDDFDATPKRSERPGGPWWSRSIVTLGPVAVIALALVWGIVTGRLTFNVNGAAAGDGKEVQRTVDSTRRILEDHKAQTDRVIELLQQSAQTQKENQVIQRRMCRRLSKAEAEKEECDR